RLGRGRRAVVTASLQSVVRRTREGPGTAVAGTPYLELTALAERMKAEDGRIIFDSLRPMGDEFWNMIDGERSVEVIAEAVCLEFGFDLSPGLFLPLVEGMVASGVAEIVSSENEGVHAR
ncbi:MAG: hypothetical protein ACRDJN_21770, partial [Chloroflexota bacterium]